MKTHIMLELELVEVVKLGVLGRIKIVYLLSSNILWLYFLKKTES